MITRAEAKREAFKLFYDTLTAEAPAIVGIVPPVRWEYMEDHVEPHVDAFYIRAMFETVITNLVALRTCSTGSRMYATEGVVTFKIYGPRFKPDTTRLSEELAAKIQIAFDSRRTGSQVWFRNGRIDSTYPEDQFLRTVFTTEFYFTEVR